MSERVIRSLSLSISRLEVEREHVLCDHVPFDLSQGKIAGGVAQGPAGVEKAVEPVAFVRHMPVVEKVIVQKSAPDQGPFIQPDLQIAVQEPGDQEAGAGHGDGMREYGDLPVLEKILFQLHAWRIQNVSPVSQKLSVIDDFPHGKPPFTAK